MRARAKPSLTAATARLQGQESLSALRRQAEVSVCALAVEVQDEPGHLAVTNVEQVRSLLQHPPKLQPACLAASAAVDEREDAPAVELAVLVRFDPVLLPGAEEVAPALGHAGHPGPAAGDGPVGVHVVDLGMRPINVAEVATLPGRVNRPDEIQVLLRHRLLRHAGRL